MRITLTQPDDWHLHLRDGIQMSSVLAATSRCFKRAIVMPNLKPAITTVNQAQAYREQIITALPTNSHFNPLMTLYLTENMPVTEIGKLKDSEHVVAVKYYPAKATTNSEQGVVDVRSVWEIFEAMQKYEIPLLIHGEVTADSVDIFHRERVFIEEILDPLMEHFPSLRIVLEHITTQDAVEYVAGNANDNLAATITAHHLLMNRNDIFKGGINPHHYCLPILKAERHRQALLKAATSGNPKFFLGTDSAPHALLAKESACGCAGIYSAPAALELYAEAFEQVEALDKLEGFASFYGADFYRLPRNTETVTLEKRTWQMPNDFEFGKEKVVPLRAGKAIAWQQIV